MEEALPATAAGPKEDSQQEKVLTCSFCSKTQKEVRKLICGPVALICNECVDLCSDIIAEETVNNQTRSLHGLVRLAMDETAFDPEELPLLLKAVEDQDVPFVLTLYKGKLEQITSAMADCLADDPLSQKQRLISNLTLSLVTILQCAGLLGVTAQEVSDEVARWLTDRQQQEV